LIRKSGVNQGPRQAARLAAWGALRQPVFSLLFFRCPPAGIRFSLPVRASALARLAIGPPALGTRPVPGPAVHGPACGPGRLAWGDCGLARLVAWPGCCMARLWALARLFGLGTAWCLGRLCLARRTRWPAFRLTRARGPGSPSPGRLRGGGARGTGVGSPGPTGENRRGVGEIIALVLVRLSGWDVARLPTLDDRVVEGAGRASVSTANRLRGGTASMAGARAWPGSRQECSRTDLGGGGA